MGHHLKNGQGGTDDLAQLVGVSLEYVLGSYLQHCIIQLCVWRGPVILEGRQRQEEQEEVSCLGEISSSCCGQAR